MPLSLQFNYLIQDETAKKAIDSFVGVLEKAFEQYRDLWVDHIKLQEKHKQCNVSRSSPSQMTITESCVKTEDDQTVETQLNSNIIVQDSSNNSVLSLDPLHTDAQDFFEDDIEMDLANLSEDFLDSSSPSKSPVFSKIYPKTSSTVTKKFIQSSEAASPTQHQQLKSTADTQIFYNEKVPSKCKQKLEISTTYHVETTFLPNGKKLKQSRLMFHPVKHDKEEISLFDVDEFKLAGTMQKTEQKDQTDTLFIKEPITIKDNTEANEIFEDVTEISPTQRIVQSKPGHCLKLKRKVPSQTIIDSPDIKYKNKHHRLASIFSTKTAIDNKDFSSCSSPKHIFEQVIYDKTLTKDSDIDALKHNTNINNFSLTHKSSKADVKSMKFLDNQGRCQTVKDKVQHIFQNLNNYEEETFYLPVEQAAKQNDTDNFTLNDTENKPPAKKPLLSKFHILSKKKENISELNMRCKTDRAKLNGHDCWECEQYYKNLSLSKEELQKRKNQCSRHRQKYKRPNTPEGFWDPEFPETLSCSYNQNIK